MIMFLVAVIYEVIDYRSHSVKYALERQGKHFAQTNVCLSCDNIFFRKIKYMYMCIQINWGGLYDLDSGLAHFIFFIRVFAVKPVGRTYLQEESLLVQR